jgi:hypothetical protein
VSVSPACAGTEPLPSNDTVSGAVPDVGLVATATASSPYLTRQIFPPSKSAYQRLPSGPISRLTGPCAADANAMRVAGAGTPFTSGNMTHMQLRE